MRSSDMIAIGTINTKELMRVSLCQKTKKISYPTEVEAKIALARQTMMSKRHSRQRFQEEPQRFYRCEFCRTWHLTSQPKRDAEPVD